MQILSHPDAREHHGYDAAVCLATLVNYRKHEVEIGHYLWCEMLPFFSFNVCVCVDGQFSVCVFSCVSSYTVQAGQSFLALWWLLKMVCVCVCVLVCVCVRTSTLLTVFFGSFLPTAVLVQTLSRRMN